MDWLFPFLPFHFSVHCGSFIHSNHPFIHSLMHWFVHLFIDSFIHSSLHLFSHSELLFISFTKVTQGLRLMVSSHRPVILVLFLGLLYSSSDTQGQIVGARESLKRVENNGAKKSKERGTKPLGIISYQTSSKGWRPFWLLIGATKLLCFSAQSEGCRPWSRFVCCYIECTWMSTVGKRFRLVWEQRKTEERDFRLWPCS